MVVTAIDFSKSIALDLNRVIVSLANDIRQDRLSCQLRAQHEQQQQRRRSRARSSSFNRRLIQVLILYRLLKWQFLSISFEIESFIGAHMCLIIMLMPILGRVYLDKRLFRDPVHLFGVRRSPHSR